MSNLATTASSILSRGTWDRLGIVLEPIEPWEGHFIQNFTSTVEPLHANRWRLWYSVNGPEIDGNIAFAEGRIGQPMARQQAVLCEGDPIEADLSIGNLPNGWRPVQPTHIRLHNGKHRLYFWAHGPGVVRYLAAESSDGRRYRVLDARRPLLWHPNDRAVSPSTIREVGLTPSFHQAQHGLENEPEADHSLVCNDATTVYQMCDGTFELYTAALFRVDRDDPRYVAHDNAPGIIRVIDRMESEDGLCWENRQRVLQPDQLDSSDLQFYHLSVTHTPQGRIGLLGHYRVEAQTMDLEPCFSTDGVKWQRPTRRGWLDRGCKTEGDSWGIYPPQSLICHEKEWWMFYTGVNHAHNYQHSNGPPTSVIMAARYRTVFEDTIEGKSTEVLSQSHDRS